MEFGKILFDYLAKMKKEEKPKKITKGG